MSGGRVAAIQLASGPNLAANLAEAEQHITDAAELGATLVVLPENFARMGRTLAALSEMREADGEGPIQGFLARQARTHRIWLCGAGVPMACGDPARIRAACLLYDDRGQRAARYDKLHLFDATVQGETLERFRESELVEAGAQVTLVETPVGRVGLAASYDLRFPELFRVMALRGVDVIALSAAFTVATGRAHWEVLVRARAIENLSYVVAAAQGGFHVTGRETFGDSMIVDPWGNMAARRPKGAGVIVHDVDLNRLASIRRGFPTLDHFRLRFEAP